MLDTIASAPPSDAESSRLERVDLPQSYPSWREYAFSEAPETEPE